MLSCLVRMSVQRKMCCLSISLTYRKPLQPIYSLAKETRRYNNVLNISDPKSSKNILSF